MPLPGWMPSLLTAINWGCTNSAVGALSSDLEAQLATGQALCIELWPFIKSLPENISLVRDALPESMEPARKLLSQLADDERYYQRLYIQQCKLASTDEADLAKRQPTLKAQRLCQIFSRYCSSVSSEYQQGILAVVTAELVATCYSRFSLPIFERCFHARHGETLPDEVEEGLEWLRLHTRPHTKNALWMTKMLKEMGGQSPDLPLPVADVLDAFLSLWRCPEGAPWQMQVGAQAFETTLNVTR